MIPEIFITEWQHQQAPWSLSTMTEQDLIISRILIDLYNQPVIKNSLIFRGGTALNKIYLKPATRYSEDLDFVQKKPEPIGPVISAIRKALDSWLGTPKRKFTQRSIKLIYQFINVDNFVSKIKIEINTTEHFQIYEPNQIHYRLESGWHKGNCIITTYQLKEMMGTKLKALYQRRKGRDLFDLWYVLDKKLITAEDILFAFSEHIKLTQENITRAMFEKSLFEKQQKNDFVSDMDTLLNPEITYSFSQALKLIRRELIAELPGDAWVKGERLNPIL